MVSKPTRPTYGTNQPGAAGKGRFSSGSPGRGAAWATGFSLLFLFVSLLALVLLPRRLEDEIRELRGWIEGVLEPAESSVAEIQSAQGKQREAVFSFLLLGDAQSRQRYREAREREEEALDTLDSLVDRLVERPPGADSLSWWRETMATLLPLSFSRHVSHEGILNRDLSEVGGSAGNIAVEYRPLLIAEMETFTQISSLTAALRDSLSVRKELKESEMAGKRFRQGETTQVLLVLGLLATAVVLVLAGRLRALMRELETRRREALKARRDADALLGATGDGVLGMDPQGRCTFLNRAGADLLGYSPRGVIGRDVHDLLHHSYPDGRDFPREDCPIMQALETGETISGRNETLLRAGRKMFPVQISVRAMTGGARSRGAVLSFTDMTETRAAEASLRQAVQARDEVLAVVSHDLRNPVGTIFSAASLLLTLNPSPEKRREHLLAVKRSAERINRLIQDLLDVARLEAGVLPVHSAPFHAERLLREVMDGHGTRAEEREVSLTCSVPEGIPVAWGDRHRMVQVLTNLLENALRETPAGGEITLGVQEDPAASGFRFFVSDTGPGIRPEDQEKLFDRFWQVSRKDKGGAGLGLSIVKGIVETHKGRVWVESIEGDGSTFWFFLPGKPEETL